MNALQAPVENPIDSNRLQQLRKASGSGPVLILTHDNPDPDALASGKALGTVLIEAWGIPSRLVYSGLVARAENKAMLQLLTPEWELADEVVDIQEYSAIALVDTQPGAGNSYLAWEISPQIVIDHHHPMREGLHVVEYVDVRPDVGATSSMLFQYLESAGIVPDALLATAIFYGIQADTRSLSRGDSPADQKAYFTLLYLIDRQKLIQVEQAGLPPEYFRAFSKGLEAARVYGQAVVAYLGSIHRPDFGAEMADLLIRLDTARAVLCLSLHAEVLHLSLRTTPAEQDAGFLIQRVIIPPGKAGGHGTMAGGQVPLTEQTVGAVVAEIERRFLAAMGECNEGVSLLS